MSLRRLACLLAVMLPLSTLPSLAQLDRTSSIIKNLDGRGVSLSLDVYTDALFGRDREHAVRTAPLFIDFGTSVDLGRWSRMLSHTTAFTSLHLNETAAGEFSTPLQSVSSVQAESGARVAELWLEHELRAGIHFRIGKIDGNRDFAFVENGADFLNAAAGYTPTFVTLPNYNDSRPGAEILWSSRKVHVNVAAFSPVHGTGALLIEEAGTSWTPRGWNGRIAAGYWRMTGRMPALNGWKQRGANGAYLVAEQKFWQHTSRGRAMEQSLSAYGQWGRSGAEFSPMPRQAALGILWRAPLELRHGDAAGFSRSSGQSAECAAGNYYFSHIETVWETFYRVQISKVISVTPDFQYITESHDSTHPAYAIGARVNLSLHPNAE